MGSPFSHPRTIYGGILYITRCDMFSVQICNAWARQPGAQHYFLLPGHSGSAAGVPDCTTNNFNVQRTLDFIQPRAYTDSSPGQSSSILPFHARGLGSCWHMRCSSPCTRSYMVSEFQNQSNHRRIQMHSPDDHPCGHKPDTWNSPRPLSSSPVCQTDTCVFALGK